MSLIEWLWRTPRHLLKPRKCQKYKGRNKRSRSEAWRHNYAVRSRLEGLPTTLPKAKRKNQCKHWKRPDNASFFLLCRLWCPSEWQYLGHPKSAKELVTISLFTRRKPPDSRHNARDVCFGNPWLLSVRTAGGHQTGAIWEWITHRWQWRTQKLHLNIQ